MTTNDKILVLVAKYGFTLPEGVISHGGILGTPINSTLMAHQIYDLCAMAFARQFVARNKYSSRRPIGHTALGYGRSTEYIDALYDALCAKEAK